MSLLLLVINLVTIIALGLIGTAILVRNPHAKSNRLYFAMTIFTALWILSNYFSNNMSISEPLALVANHLVLLFPGLVLVSFLGFVTNLGGKQEQTKVVTSLMVILTMIYLLTLTPLVVTGIEPAGDVYAIQFGIFAPLYFLAMLLNIVVSLYILFKEQRHGEKLEKQKNGIILWSFFLTIVINLFTNVALPYLNNAFVLTNIGPLSAIFIAIGSAYAILKHHLFDIRFFVVRAAAYGFTLMLLTLFYILPTVWIVSRVLDVDLSPFKLIALAAVTYILTFVYRYTRKEFDRLTNRIFYRHYYSSDEVVDQLSNLLVHTIDIEHLQQGSKKIIVDALGIKTLEYWLNDGKHDKESKGIERLFVGAKIQNIVVLDELMGHPELLRQLREKDIATVVRLRTTHGELGYMMLGFKLSGEQYTQKDKRLLSTIADEIAISMQNALHFDEIQNFNKTLQGRIGQATNELRHANDKLKALDATKDEFITMASHQLRTPLTSVKGYLSMVLEGDVGKLNAQQKKLLTQSYISSQRMVYVISDLLNLSRLNTGKFVIESTPVNLDEIIVGEIDQLKETAHSREVKVAYHSPAAFPTMLLDETKIHQVVMNFLDNAIYYTPAGGQITIELEETATSVEFRVKDNGIGVPRAEQRHLFTKFYRADNARRARPDGTGLGLFMAKKVIAAQGGSIVFESEEGKGSTFGFRFSKAHHLASSSIKSDPKVRNAA